MSRPYARALDRAGCSASRPSSGNVTGSCVIGAVALAMRQRDPRAELTVDGGPAIDFVWDAVQESRGLVDPGSPDERRPARCG
jgi:hypothetical protein